MTNREMNVLVQNITLYDNNNNAKNYILGEMGF